jgi:hypothetical protein
MKEIMIRALECAGTLLVRNLVHRAEPQDGGGTRWGDALSPAESLPNCGPGQSGPPLPIVG